MPIGPAILWMPLFVVAAVASALARAAGLEIGVDGYGTLFQLSAAMSGIAAATIGAWLTYLLCAAWFGSRVAVWATVTVWIGSSALYYSLVSPAYSHAGSMLAAGLFFYVWAKGIGDVRLSRFSVIGLCAGAAALVRWQDIVFLLAPVVEVCWLTRAQRGAVSPGRAIAVLAACAAAAAIAFVPQNIVWLVLYGTPFTVPQGGEFMKWTEPALLRVLFSDWHGLVSWTPIAGIAIAGLLVGAAAPGPGPGATTPDTRVPTGAPSRPHALRVVFLGAVAVFLASWYVNAAAADWWAGEAFGSRRFVSCFAIFTLGVAAIGRRLATRPAVASALAVAVCVSNLLLLLQYQLFMHGRRASYPAVYAFDHFVFPVRLLAQWWRG